MYRSRRPRFRTKVLSGAAIAVAALGGGLAISDAPASANCGTSCFWFLDNGDGVAFLFYNDQHGIPHMRDLIYYEVAR